MQLKKSASAPVSLLLRTYHRVNRSITPNKLISLAALEHFNALKTLFSSKVRSYYLQCRHMPD